MQEGELNKLQQILEAEESVHAMWLEGSHASGANDEYSDLDIWLDVEDGKEKQIYKKVEDFLKSKGGLDINFDSRNWHPQIDHKTYHINGRNPYMILEVNIQSHSRDFQFVEGLHHIIVLFDKSSVTKMVPLDNGRHQKELENRKQFLLEKISVGKTFLNKEILRKNFLEALHNYNFWLLESVVELARIKYSPAKISFGLKHASRDLPRNVVSKLEAFHKVQNLKDLQTEAAEIEKYAKELA